MLAEIPFPLAANSFGKFFLNFGTQWEWLLAISVFFVALIPPINRILRAVLDRLHNPSPAQIRINSVLIAIASALFLYTVNRLQQREFIPCWHDESMYLMQAQMLAHGHLWMPQHPLAEFFQTFHVFERPVYAPIYFPGTALLYAPMMEFALPPWILSLTVCSAIAGLLYIVTCKIFDAIAALLAVLMLVGLGYYRYMSIMTLSHTTIMLFALLMIWTWLNWRKNHRAAWALAFGIFAGWSAIIRPLDALCFTVPLGISFLIDLARDPRVSPQDRSSARPDARTRRLVATLTLIILGAAPFLSLQLIFNLGVTGKIFTTPFSQYVHEYFPEVLTGVGLQSTTAPVHDELPQFKQYRNTMIAHGRDHYRNLTWSQLLDERIHTFSFTNLTSPLLLLFLLAGLVVLFDRRYWPVCAAFPLLFLYYLFWPFFSFQNSIILVIPATFTILAGVEKLAHLARSRREFLATACRLTIAIPAIVCLAQIEPNWHGVPYTMFPQLADIDKKIAPIRARGEQAIVLFRFVDVENSAHTEPVYNLETPWPDDAQIIRTHDLGPENNKRIFAYYAARQPNRMFYIYIRATGELIQLGASQSLAAQSN